MPRKLTPEQKEQREIEKEIEKQKELAKFDRSEYIIEKIPKERDPNHLPDPLKINPRLAKWISELIENRHLMNISEQVRAVAAIARIQYLFMQLRAEAQDDKSKQSESGTEVKRFAKAFAANANRRRKGLTRRQPEPEITGLIENGQSDDELEY